MKKVIFLPRFYAARWNPLPGSILISICNPDDPSLPAQPGWAEIHTVRFDDSDIAAPGIVLFDVEMAENILKLVERHKETAPELVVHCQMGVSRSAAVAIYISEVLGIPCFKENSPVTHKSWPQYNRKVYRVMAHANLGDYQSAFGPILDMDTE